MDTQPYLFRPMNLLRAEAVMALFIACLAYQHWFPHRWILFACLFLIPDLTLFFFLRGPSDLASVSYNTAHSYVLPALLGIIAFYRGSVVFGEASLIWLSHIALDRILGYGLKYPTSFSFTHIQSAGYAQRPDK